jgi:hypothetical protein
MAAEMLAGAHGREWPSCACPAFLAVFNRLAGYADVNGAERLRHDAAMLDVWFHTLGARIS